MKLRLLRIVLIGFFFALVLIAGASAALSQDSGGVTGADFLTSVPTVRTNAMGGVLDGLDNYLEALHINPAGLAPIERLSFLLTVQPYPNDVSNNQLSFGMPLLGGVIGSSVQLLNTGGFTYINESLQPENTVSVYDAAATFGYSRYLWNSLAVGMNLKAVYRTLGEYNAFAIGADFGGMYRFETPHVGKRPKPPKHKKLESEYNAKVNDIEDEREKRIRETYGEVWALEREIESLQKEIGALSGKIDSVESEKQQPLIAKREELENNLSNLHSRLIEQQEQSKEGIEAIDAWYSDELQAAQEAYHKKLSDLQDVESERIRLFALINDPERELTEEMINTSIDEAVEKTQTYLIERTTALNEESRAYAEIREKRIAEIEEEIEFYRNRITEETGPEIQKLQERLNSLEVERKRIEASNAEDKKDQLQEIGKQISTVQRELEAAKSDPWIKRLDQRIGEKEKAIDALNGVIESKNEETGKIIEDVKKAVQNDIDVFNIARELLNRELKKAKLKRELDLLNANKEKQKKKAYNSYEEKENKIYTELLSVIYRNEENIINARSEALKLAFENRRYDLETQMQKDRERIEDEFAFQERYLSNKISELQKKVKSDEGGEVVAGGLASLQDELSGKQQSYKEELEELEKKKQQLVAEEVYIFEKNMEDLAWQKTVTRLIYLQTDDPYLNTSVHASLTNAGSKVKFVEEGYPLPTAAHIGAGYAILNTSKHTVRLGVQLDIPFYDEIALGVGAEYGFHNQVFVRTGYSFLTPYRSLSAGLGARVPMGFTDISVDYTFQPIPDYGLVHSFGIGAYF